MSVGWLVCLTGKKVTRVTVVTMVEVDRVPMVNMDTITRDTMVEVTTVAVTMVIVMARRVKKLARRANNLESGSEGAYIFYVSILGARKTHLPSSTWTL